jgi:hypothetical protein
MCSSEPFFLAFIAIAFASLFELAVTLTEEFIFKYFRVLLSPRLMKKSSVKNYQQSTLSMLRHSIAPDILMSLSTASAI